MTPATLEADTAPVEDDMNKREMNALDEVQALTGEMRQHADAIARLGKRRRIVVLRLRDNRVTYRQIAEAMGVSEQAVYKIIRGDL